MKLETRLALKFILPRPGSFMTNLLSLTSVVSIAFSVALFLIVLSLMHSSGKQLMDRMILVQGQLEISVSDIESAQKMVKNLSIQYPKSELALLYETDALFVSSYFPENPAGVRLLAYSEEYPGRFKDLKGLKITQSENVSSEDRSAVSISIGQELARNFDINFQIPESIDLLVPLAQLSFDGELLPAVKRARVQSIFDSGYYLFNEKWVFLSFKDRIGLFPENLMPKIRVWHSSEKVIQEIKNKEEQNSAVESISDWKNRNKSIWTALVIEKRAMLFLLLMMIFFSALNIFSFLLIFIVDHLRNFAMLMSLGLNLRQLKNLLKRMSLLVSGLGTVLGILLALALFAFLKAFSEHMHPALQQMAEHLTLSVSDIALALLAAPLFCFLLALLSARQIKKIQLLELLNQDV